MIPDPYFPPYGRIPINMMREESTTPQLTYVDQVSYEARVDITFYTLDETHKQRKRADEERNAPARSRSSSASTPAGVYTRRIHASHKVEIGHGEDQAAELIPVVDPSQRKDVRAVEYAPYPIQKSANWTRYD